MYIKLRFPVSHGNLGTTSKLFCRYADPGGFDLESVLERKKVSRYVSSKKKSRSGSKS